MRHALIRWCGGAQLYPADIRYPFLGAPARGGRLYACMRGHLCVLRCGWSRGAAAVGAAARGWRLSERARAGYGTCFPPVQRGEFYDVRCVGPEELLKPGQVRRLTGCTAELACWGHWRAPQLRSPGGRQTYAGPSVGHMRAGSKDPCFLHCVRCNPLTSVLTSALADACAPRAQIKNAMTLLASPYLHNGLAVVVNQTSQLINAAGRPVPLSEVRRRLQEGLLVAGSLRGWCVVWARRQVGHMDNRGPDVCSSVRMQPDVLVV